MSSIWLWSTLIIWKSYSVPEVVSWSWTILGSGESWGKNSQWCEEAPAAVWDWWLWNANFLFCVFLTFLLAPIVKTEYVPRKWVRTAFVRNVLWHIPFRWSVCFNLSILQCIRNLYQLNDAKARYFLHKLLKRNVNVIPNNLKYFVVQSCHN